ncbi:MAG: glycosyl hydrolase family 28-related protein [Candidatus Sumerlaeota bacterium]|nr:glycosyl hydrolase family 28-related protein [Candidatus Sumerlaeota bacterium]
MRNTLQPLAAIGCLLGGLAWGATPSTAKTPEPKWRVVDTKYPTDDVVVAGFSAQDFGAKGDGVSDDTAAFQNALDAMAAAGGRLILSQSDFMNHGKGLFAQGGELSLVNTCFRKEGEILNVSPKAHATAIASTVNGQLISDR